MGGINKIQIPSSTKNLAKIRKFVEEKAVEMGFDPTLTNQIVLSVDEACTNIIKYTHKYDENEQIELKVGLGIPLMRKFMNDIVYVHKKPDNNSLILTKFLP